MNAACALLLLFVEEAEAVAELWLRPWLRLKLWLMLMLMLHSAQKQGKKGEGFTCSNSHTKGQTKMGKEKGSAVQTDH